MNFRVSSVLNNDRKQFGKTNLTDDNEETCWNSAEGSSQWIYCLFKDNFILKQFNIQFQGGFSSKKIVIVFMNDEKTVFDEVFVYPEDNNLLQTFTINNDNRAKVIKFLLCDCTDIFGRIIAYKFEMFGLFYPENE